MKASMEDSVPRSPATSCLLESFVTSSGEDPFLLCQSPRQSIVSPSLRAPTREQVASAWSDWSVHGLRKVLGLHCFQGMSRILEVIDIYRLALKILTKLNAL